ncbi:hypothetical protein [Myxococcus phage Mx1]|nr:hypothetical protein [Myxococcus phage Mx1]
MGSIKIRDFQRLLKDVGAKEIRTSGTHQIWELPGGKRFPIVIGSGEISQNIRTTARKAFKESGLKVTF